MPTKPRQIQRNGRIPRASDEAAQIAGPRQTRGHRPRDTVYAAPDVVQDLRLRRLNWRHHWAHMQLGDAKPLANELDKIINEGVPPHLINRHLRDTARQHGAQADVVSRLLIRGLFQWQRRRLAHPTFGLAGAAMATVNGRHSRLNEVAERSRKALLSGLLTRALKLQELRQRMATAWRSMPRNASARLREATPDFRFRCELVPADHRLVSIWPHNPTGSIAEEVRKLESARRAEKAALAYYRSLGQHVEDVSIQQLDGRTANWSKFDLRADGRPLDVKNVRCSREDRFAEHRWNRQKQHEALDVPIVGVVTMEDSGYSIVTGEFLHGDLDRFRDQIVTYGCGPTVSAPKRNWSTFVPGWLLEYPIAHYASMPDWADVTRRWLHISDELEADVPPWIRGLVASRLPSLRHASLQTKVLQTIKLYFQHFSLSRRTVFWFVLIYMLSHARDPRPADELIKHLFPDDAKDFPLGLFDPRNYVWGLIHTLNQMIEANRPLLESVSHFHLSGFGILQAPVDDQWVTILAYCGNCGKWPIFLGKADTTYEHELYGNGSCRKCPCDSGRLVCDECDSCSGQRCREGIPYETVRAAQVAAQAFPGWRQIGNVVYPPDQKEPPQLHP